ncbi:nuclear rna export factor [Holotrichia oblita]|uniref:Nuclear rna export factor n=1 Tax=Holotrichia oblita TaxID=644536 RepID=A0ACB9T8K6_HOLOL|nr:nuclear rna export factor [Holotrichia oblita]
MSVIIDQFNVNSGIVKKYKDALHSNTKWHKVIVENVGDLDKLTVLNTIMKFCYPLHFIPVHYESCNNKAHFLLKNCGSAIERICNQNLIIKHPCINEQPFKLSIHLSTASTDDVRINIQDNVMKILYKRFNSQKGLLNLDNFVSDPDLEEFCPLSQPKLLFYIFHLSKNLPIKYLKLSNNQIESLKAMEGLSGMTTLIGIDLHNNGISSMAEISYLREFQLEELCLDGNPLCDKCDEFSYGKDAKRLLPTLKKIDGYRIQSNPFVQHRRNYLCSQTGFDLVDQFLEHYFTLYDADNRSVLDGLYHEEAIFSLTASFKSMQSTSTNARLQAYNKVSRNLMNLATFTGSDEFLFAGPSDILKVLCALPQSEHDPFSFNVDLISYTEKIAILIVSGIFREMKQTLVEEDRLLYFTRTFVLRAGNDREYTILNEMVHISNATTFQASIAFKKVRAPTDDYIPIPRPKNTEEMLEILRAIETLTGMNREWSKTKHVLVQNFTHNLVCGECYTGNGPIIYRLRNVILMLFNNSGSHISTKRTDIQIPVIAKRGTVDQSQTVSMRSIPGCTQKLIVIDNLIKNRVVNQNTSEGRKLVTNVSNFNAGFATKELPSCTQTSSDYIIKSKSNHSYIQRSIPVIQRGLSKLEPKKQTSKDVRIRRIRAANEDSSLIQITVDKTFPVAPK